MRTSSCTTRFLPQVSDFAGRLGGCEWRLKVNGRKRAAPPGPNNFEVGLWELRVHGSRLPGLQLRGEKKKVWGVSKGFAVALHMGTDIMRLCLMPGSGKGYDLTPGLWWNSAIRHASLDQGLQLPAHLFMMQVACGGAAASVNPDNLPMSINWWQLSHVLPGGPRLSA